MAMFYGEADIAVRENLDRAHANAWARLGGPGTWWTAQERVAIAAEARHARQCTVCAQQRGRQGPPTVDARHESLGQLEPALTDIIHRVMTGSRYLTRPWFEAVVEAGITLEAYVEAIGVIAIVVSIDTVRRGLGEDEVPLPEPVRGAPSRYRPGGAKDHGAWVPMIASEDLQEAEKNLYKGRLAPNIQRALSLVPEEVQTLTELHAAQYLPFEKVNNVRASLGALSRPQMELLAGRVSAINGCHY